MPRDAALELRFDRYLLPRTAVRQSVLLYAGFEENFVFLQPYYDVIERVVRYRLPAGSSLQPGLLYSVKLVLPDRVDSFGFRAYDGAPLEAGRVPLEFSFRTARRDPDPAPAADRAPTCSDILTIFGQAGCSATECHGGSTPSVGLKLDSAEGLLETAVSRVARETDIGPEVGQSLVDSPRFGVGMPVIDPGNPGNSYLLYKLLSNRGNFGTSEDSCASRYSVPLPGSACLPPSTAETQRLHDRFLLLDPMPPPPAALPSLEALRDVQQFITEGADCDL